MVSSKVFRWLAVATVCSFLLAAGCTPKTASMVLKFTPDDLTTYRVATDAEKSVEYEGTLAQDASLTGGHTGTTTEMIFTQQIQSVDESGSAVARITIKQLKYLSKVKDVVDVDFDSARDEDRNNPMYKLLGQSYTIKVAPSSKVVELVDLKTAQQAVRGGSPAHKAAQAMIGPQVVKERHIIPALSVADQNEVRVGDEWSYVKSFSFGLLGSKSYEKIYTVKEIKDIDGRQIATVEMDAIPAAGAAERSQDDDTPDLSPMFDTDDEYTGTLELDATAGRVEKCLEKMRSEWIIVDPAAEHKPDKEPGLLRMAVVRVYDFERID